MCIHNINTVVHLTWETNNHSNCNNKKNKTMMVFWEREGKGWGGARRLFDLGDDVICNSWYHAVNCDANINSLSLSSILYPYQHNFDTLKGMNN